MSDLFVSTPGVRRSPTPGGATPFKICCADGKVRLPGIEEPPPELLALLTGDGPAQILFLAPTERIEARRGFNGPPEKVRRLDTAYQHIASPSFSLLPFTPYPSHPIPSPLMKEAPTQPSYNVADGKRTALSVDDVDRLAAMYAEQRTTITMGGKEGIRVAITYGMPWWRWYVHAKRRLF
ncbi:BZ3500_MvSof-1268-A1-R1_Chr6-3g08666 [Microbotryum saponariae]|uniref:BZ3500_MvSof-1268-A1-R1_Chr6-3g08666 protein n=1 Tax=Microbotryum saponariae TaxID=289078 RepID=A0A2X0NNC3_9BASI|nr:BZ3500_MvSof-1268-A1-R1_Chr6-3g08666 [Microbotryum saponariae]SDA07267.1 BZ3501_MvSof-1269-A2-R1_Chr6-2g08369 [Microbotryum saponariae]